MKAQKTNLFNHMKKSVRLPGGGTRSLGSLPIQTNEFYDSLVPQYWKQEGTAKRNTQLSCG